MKRNLSAKCASLLLAGALGAAPTVAFAAAPAAAGDQVAMLQEAITTLASFQASIARSLQVVSTINLGPYSIGGSCDYDCFIGICVHTEHWSGRPDFSRARVPLQQMLGQAQQQSGQFAQSFAPVHDWMLTTLPRFSAAFGAAAAQIQQTNAAIIKAGGTATPAQQAAIQASLKAISADLQQGAAQLNPGIQAMAVYTKQQIANQQALTSLRANLQNAIDGELKAQQTSLVNELHCGQGDAENELKKVASQFDGQFQTIQNSFNTMAAQANAAEQASERLLGTVLNLQSEYSSVGQQLAAAGIAPGPLIQTLHLDIAQKDWAALAQIAQQIK